MCIITPVFRTSKSLLNYTSPSRNTSVSHERRGVALLHLQEALEFRGDIFAKLKVDLLKVEIFCVTLKCELLVVLILNMTHIHSLNWSFVTDLVSVKHMCDTPHNI